MGFLLMEPGVLEVNYIVCNYPESMLPNHSFCKLAGQCCTILLNLQPSLIGQRKLLRLQPIPFQKTLTHTVQFCTAEWEIWGHNLNNSTVQFTYPRAPFVSTKEPRYSSQQKQAAKYTFISLFSYRQENAFCILFPKYYSKGFSNKKATNSYILFFAIFCSVR